jgi:hypothetical protein
MESSWELNLGQKMSLPILTYDNFGKKIHEVCQQGHTIFKQNTM